VGPIGVGDSLRFGTSLATSCVISSTSGNLITRVAGTSLLQNSDGASICESTGSDKTTVFFGGVSAPILQASMMLSDNISASATSTVTVGSNLQVNANLTVAGDAYADKVVSPLVQAFVLESDTLRPTVNPGVTVEGDLHVTGNISYGTLQSPYWVAGRINGVSVTTLSSKGRHDFSVERLQTGYYKVSWTPEHPDGANFIVFAQGEGTGSTWNILHDATDSVALANSPTSVTFIARDHNFNITNGIVNFAVLA